MIIIGIVIAIAANTKTKLLDGMMPLYVQKLLNINVKHHKTSIALVVIILLVPTLVD
jgi:hypothetical protein